jgi:hypothetical protein
MKLTKPSSFLSKIVKTEKYHITFPASGKYGRDNWTLTIREDCRLRV